MTRPRNGGGLLSGRPPINPRQILLVNFLTDVAYAVLDPRVKVK